MSPHKLFTAAFALSMTLVAFGAQAAEIVETTVTSDAPTYEPTAPSTNEMLGDQSITADTSSETTMDLEIVNEESDAVAQGRLDPVEGYNPERGDSSSDAANSSDMGSSALPADVSESRSVGSQIENSAAGDS